jgi:hypothetical protein
MIRLLPLLLLFTPLPASAASPKPPAPPVVIANDAAFAPVQAWQEAVARETDRRRIVDQLYRYAAADAVDDVRTDASKALLPRRTGGAMMVWRRVRPQVEPGKRRAVIDRWMRARAQDMVATFDRLGWANNLDAAGAMAIYATGDALNDGVLRQAGLRIARRVLDQIDADGFTKEIHRDDRLANAKPAAEYYSHETMIYLVALAQMSGRLWNEPGRAGGQPAMLRAGRLLDADLGTGARFAAKTGHRQKPYPSAVKLQGGSIPSGYLGCWIPPFLAHYRGDFLNLRAASAFYATRPARLFNATVGGTMP